MSHLGRRVDELQIDALERRPLAVRQQGLAQSDDALLRSNAAALDHQEIVVDLSVMRETAHGGNRLVGDVVLGRGRVLDDLRMKD